MLIGPISCRLQSAPYTDGQDQEHHRLALYGQPFMISTINTDTGDEAEFVLERWTLEQGLTLLPTQTSPTLL